MQRQRLGVMILSATTLVVTAASHRVGLADSPQLAQPGSCASDPRLNHCQKASAPPCPNTADCTDYFRWFSNAVACRGTPGASAASFKNAQRTSAYWTDCYDGFDIGGDVCTRGWVSCGTVELYSSGDCSMLYYCSIYSMQGCYGMSPAVCY